jgi:hypothetical protein
MSNNGRIFCYGLALVCFVVAAILSRTNKADWTLTLVSAGLAFIALVPLWDAVAAS